jgi:hypothetical protein
VRQNAEKYPTDDVCSPVRLREEQAGIEVRLSPGSG